MTHFSNLYVDDNKDLLLILKLAVCCFNSVTHTHVQKQSVDIYLFKAKLFNVNLHYTKMIYFSLNILVCDIYLPLPHIVTLTL